MSSVPTKRCARLNADGFSMIELLIAVAIITIMVAVALPLYNTVVHTYRIRNDADNLMGALTVARMRGAASFARTRLSCDTTTNTCTMFSRTSGAAWPSTPNEPKRIVLSSAVRFSIPSGTPGAGNQTAAAQGRAGQANPYFIEFNSRGLPIDDTTGATVTDYAFYVTDSQYNITMAVGVDIGGRVAVYSLKDGKFVNLDQPFSN